MNDPDWKRKTESTRTRSDDFSVVARFMDEKTGKLDFSILTKELKSMRHESDKPKSGVVSHVGRKLSPTTTAKHKIDRFERVRLAKQKKENEWENMRTEYFSNQAKQVKTLPPVVSSDKLRLIFLSVMTALNVRVFLNLVHSGPAPHISVALSLKESKKRKTQTIWWASCLFCLKLSHIRRRNLHANNMKRLLLCTLGNKKMITKLHSLILLFRELRIRFIEFKARKEIAIGEMVKQLQEASPNFIPSSSTLSLLSRLYTEKHLLYSRKYYEWRQNVKSEIQQEIESREFIRSFLSIATSVMKDNFKLSSPPQSDFWKLSRKEIIEILEKTR
jgi:hypothetical protein